MAEPIRLAPPDPDLIPDPDLVPDPRERLTISVPEAGRLLGIGKSAAYAAAERGEIPTIGVGRRNLKVPTNIFLATLLSTESAGDGLDSVLSGFAVAIQEIAAVEQRLAAMRTALEDQLTTMRAARRRA